MSYVGWDGREYEDVEMDNMRRDAAEAAHDARVKFYYKNIITDRIQWTAAKFQGWHGPDGLLQVFYAMFLRPSGELLFIPEYLLTGDTRALLPNH